jgi:hypothetical protein
MTYRYEIDFHSDSNHPLPKGWHQIFPLAWLEAREIARRLYCTHSASYSYEVQGFELDHGYYKRDGFWLKDEIYTSCGHEDTVNDFLKYKNEQHWIDVRG